MNQYLVRFNEIQYPVVKWAYFDKKIVFIVVWCCLKLHMPLVLCLSEEELHTSLYDHILCLCLIFQSIPKMSSTSEIREFIWQYTICNLKLICSIFLNYKIRTLSAICSLKTGYGFYYQFIHLSDGHIGVLINILWIHDADMWVRGVIGNHHPNLDPVWQQQNQRAHCMPPSHGGNNCH